jgi:Ser-tRNA(Ala) deacylase AlaX
MQCRPLPARCARTRSRPRNSMRGDLLRALDVRPPVLDGRVRVVEIDGFDAQACGGTHVHSTAEIGSLSIYKTENKGRNNKRLYVRLSEPARPG